MEPVSPRTLEQAAPTSAPRAGAWRGLGVRIPMAWLQLAVPAAFLATIPVVREVDPDFWWHLRTGELILHSGIPREDVYSFTALGQDWVVHAWLSQVLMYLVQSSFGYIGNVVLINAALLGALGLMLHLARRHGAGYRALLVVGGISALMIGAAVLVRPQIFTWALFAAFVYITMRHYAGDRVPLWTLPVLMALWVNVHLGFTFGFGVLGLWIACLGVARLREDRTVDLKAPLLATGACVVAALANPRGPLILWYPIQYVFTGRTDRAIVGEWQRPPLTDLTTMFLIAGALLLAFVLLSRQRPRLFPAALAIGMFAASFEAGRNIPLAGIVLLPVAAPALAARWRWASPESDARTRIRVVPAAAVLAATVALFLGAGSSTTGVFSVREPSEVGYPSEGAAYIHEHYPGTRLFSEYHWGGYLLYKLYPDVLVFVDGRADMYGDRILSDFATIGRVEPGWDELLDRYEVEVVMMRRNYSLSYALTQEPGWTEVFAGDVERVFVRAELVVR
jgi:hypothetical protein